MRLISFLNEKYIKNIQLSRDEAEQLLESKCKNNLAAFRSKKCLYRGDDSLPEGFIYLPKKGRETRKSAHTENFYTLLFSKYLDSWKSYPKRDLGIICTTWLRSTYLYTKKKKYFKVIPFDNTPIGVCPDRDIWYAFYPKLSDYHMRDLNDFNKTLIESGITISNFKKTLDSPLTEKSPLWILYYVMKQKYPQTNIFGDKRPLPDNLKLDGKTTLKDVLNEIFDPNKNEFTIINSLSSLPSDNTECWFDGDAILIDSETDF